MKTNDYSDIGYCIIIEISNNRVIFPIKQHLVSLSSLKDTIYKKQFSKENV